MSYDLTFRDVGVQLMSTISQTVYSLDDKGIHLLTFS